MRALSRGSRSRRELEKRRDVQFTECRPRLLAVGHVTALQPQHRLQPLVQLLLAVEDQAEALVLGVERDHVFVLGVATLVDVEAAVQQDAALRRLSVLEFLLAVVILEAGETAGPLAAQHEVLLFHRLELLQVAAADHRPARGRRRTPARGHRRDDDRDDRRRCRRVVTVDDRTSPSGTRVQTLGP